MVVEWMNIAGVNPNATGPYDGVAYEIYVSGCTLHCKYCQNPELQWFEYGTPWKTMRSTIASDLLDLKGWYDCVSILGGDLLSQDRNEAREFINEIKSMTSVPIWLFTGYDVDRIPKWVWKEFDVVKYGPYVDELKQEGFPASSNQRIWRNTDAWHKSRTIKFKGEHTYLLPRR